VVYRVLSDFIALNHGPLKPAWAGGSGLIINILLNLLLVPSMGMIGAALASVVAYGVAGGVALLIFCRAEQVPVRQVLVPGRADLRSYLRLGGMLTAKALRRG